MLIAQRIHISNEIIHNPGVNERLADMDVDFVPGEPHSVLVVFVERQSPLLKPQRLAFPAGVCMCVCVCEQSRTGRSSSTTSTRATW